MKRMFFLYLVVLLSLLLVACPNTSSQKPKSITLGDVTFTDDHVELVWTDDQLHTSYNVTLTRAGIEHVVLQNTSLKSCSIALIDLNPGETYQWEVAREDTSARGNFTLPSAKAELDIVSNSNENMLFSWSIDILPDVIAIFTAPIAEDFSPTGIPLPKTNTSWDSPKSDYIVGGSYKWKLSFGYTDFAGRTSLEIEGDNFGYIEGTVTANPITKNSSDQSLYDISWSDDVDNIDYNSWEVLVSSAAPVVSFSKYGDTTDSTTLSTLEDLFPDTEYSVQVALDYEISGTNARLISTPQTFTTPSSSSVPVAEATSTNGDAIVLITITEDAPHYGAHSYNIYVAVADEDIPGTPQGSQVTSPYPLDIRSLGNYTGKTYDVAVEAVYARHGTTITGTQVLFEDLFTAPFVDRIASVFPPAAFSWESYSPYTKGLNDTSLEVKLVWQNIPGQAVDYKLERREKLNRTNTWDDYTEIAQIISTGGNDRTTYVDTIENKEDEGNRNYTYRISSNIDNNSMRETTSFSWEHFLFEPGGIQVETSLNEDNSITAYLYDFNLAGNAATINFNSSLSTASLGEFLGSVRDHESETSYYFAFHHAVGEVINFTSREDASYPLFIFPSTSTSSSTLTPNTGVWYSFSESLNVQEGVRKGIVFGFQTYPTEIVSPKNLTLSYTGTSRTLTWDDDSTDESETQDFLVEYTDDLTNGYVPVALIPGNKGNTITYTEDYWATKSQGVSYRVTAINRKSSSPPIVVD